MRTVAGRGMTTSFLQGDAADAPPAQPPPPRIHTATPPPAATSSPACVHFVCWPTSGRRRSRPRASVSFGARCASVDPFWVWRRTGVAQVASKRSRQAKQNIKQMPRVQHKPEGARRCAGKIICMRKGRLLGNCYSHRTVQNMAAGGFALAHFSKKSLIDLFWGG